MTIPSPNCPDAPLTARSGEIAALKLYVEGLVTSPDWNVPLPERLSSYQRTSAPAPPATVCCVQSACFPPCDGSIADTACVTRPSSVSRRSALPFCGASAGTSYVGTLRLDPGFWMLALPSGFLESLNSVNELDGRAFGVAIIQPASAVSTELTGTAVKVCVKSGFKRSGTNVIPRLAGSGHVEPLGGLVTAIESPRM